MTTIKTNDRELVALEVPRDSYDHFLKADCVGAVAPYGEQFFDWYSDKFDTTNCKIIGLLSDLTEQQAAEYVETVHKYLMRTRGWYMGHVIGYADYSGNNEPCNAKESLITLLTVNGLNTSAPILLIEKVK